MDIAKVIVCSALAVLGSLGMHEWNERVQDEASGSCIAPGICKPPSTTFSKVAVGPTPGQQWNIDGGFCGSYSVQQNALSVGAYVSQDLVRKSNRNSGGEHYMHGDATQGYEVVPSNIRETLIGLRLRFDEWDYTQPTPQAPLWKKWIKRHLVNGNPVVFFPMCKGDAHMPYKDSCPNGGHIDHVEAIYGIYSNHPESDEIFDDDWIIHTSDQDNNPYFRPINSLEDTPAMNGNCKDAQPGFGKNEMYPCVDSQVTYGAAVLGLGVNGTLPVTLEIDQYAEPNVRSGEPPVELYGKVTINGLRPQGSYSLYRYNSTETLPLSMSDVDPSTRVMRFTALDTHFSYEDPVPFMSNSAVYYLAL